MNNQAQQILHQCIRDYGITLCREPQRLEALLKDYAKGQFKREIFVIVQAAKENVVEQLLHNTAPLELIAGTLAHQLTENYGTDRHLADWAIESWLFALDLSCPTNKVEPSKQATPTVAEKSKPKPNPKPVTSIKPAKSTANNGALIDGRYLDNGDGTVTDQQTGLQWMRGCLGQSWKGTTCRSQAKTYNWDEANQVAKNISFAGYSDWRLPTIDELESIIEKNNTPTINHEAFPNTSSTSAVWSSSPSPNGSNGAWCVHFYGGYVTGNYKYGDLHVRLVRSINPAKSTANNGALIDGRYLDNGDGSVTDLIKKFLDLPIPPRRNLFGKLFIAECYLLQNESLVMVEPYGIGIIIDKDELSEAILNKRISANIISDRNLMVI